MTTSTLTTVANGCKTFAADVGEGFFKMTHNGLALLGMAVVLSGATLAAAPELRHAGEAQLAQWLAARHSTTTESTAAAEQATTTPTTVAVAAPAPETAAIDRATAADPKALTAEQRRLTQWISRKYHVAPEPVAALVAEAYKLGSEQKIDPKLLLAVMAIESSFNPFAQSAVGAQGLMQVMTHIHSDKYKHFGGSYAAFDPRSNLRVGAQILRDYMRRTGSVEGALKWYVGAANMASDGGYARKVLAEHERLSQAARGGKGSATVAAAPSSKSSAKLS